MEAYAKTEEGSQDIQLLEAILSRNQASLRKLLADRFLGNCANKEAAADELFDVLSKSSRVGDLTLLLETFVVEKGM